ncbi:MAG: glycosyltransferase family 39 protein [Alphaproteobacteria bacterium]|nr:glycosyltransferase family 39 protein [Alphaproteobacteria bacterium]
MYLALPKQGDIDWPDAPRHALNGAFVLDFFKAMPLRHPIEFAYDYYRQWPALTILFYPPLFYGVLAAVYAAFGVSEASALLAEFGFLLLLAWGAFRLSRHWLAPPPALAVALLLIGAPELAFWGRQIMLDIPAYAFLVWAAELLVRHLESKQRRTLFAAVACAVAAAYTKYNAIFFVLPIAVSVVYTYGRRAFCRGAVLQAAALGGVLLLPLVGIFFVFGNYNLEQAAGIPGTQGSRWTVSELTYYARILPAVVSWPTLVLACFYAAALPFSPRWRLPRGHAVMLGSWLLIGYAFYSVIAVKEPRHILFITYPIALAAVLAIDRTVAKSGQRHAVSVGVAGLILAVTLATGTVPAVAGMQQAAEAVAQLAPPETNVAFWGSRDGTFIYAMRAYSGRNDLGVVRLDKLLLGDVAVYLEHGFKENVISPDDLVDTFRNLHIQYVVFQTRYHDDLASVKALEEALGSDKFVKVDRIPMAANYGKGYMADLVIYRLKTDVPRGRVAPSMQIKLLGRSL